MKSRSLKLRLRKGWKRESPIICPIGSQTGMECKTSGQNPQYHNYNFEQNNIYCSLHKVHGRGYEIVIYIFSVYIYIYVLALHIPFNQLGF